MSMLEDASQSEEARPKATAAAYVIGVMLGLTLMGAVAGATFGRWLSSALSVVSAASIAGDAAHASAVYSATLYDLPPVIANLASPPDAWVRIQASIVLAEPKPGKVDVLAAQIAEDILGFLRTLSLTDISGASGLQHLREDLNERASIRSNGRVQELILQTLVVQ